MHTLISMLKDIPPAGLSVYLSFSLPRLSLPFFSIPFWYTRTTRPRDSTHMAYVCIVVTSDPVNTKEDQIDV